MENWRILPPLAVSEEERGHETFILPPLMWRGQCGQFSIIHNRQHRVQPILVSRSATLFHVVSVDRSTRLI